MILIQSTLTFSLIKGISDKDKVLPFKAVFMENKLIFFYSQV